MLAKKVKKEICFFCLNDIRDPDYREANLLRRFISSYFKIAPRRRSGLCALHQRKTAKAIKRAREISLLPFTPV